MALRRGIVTATHRGDNSVDIIMSDDGSPLTGVQVITSNGSNRSGFTDLPYIAPKSDLDLSKPSDQDLIAIVDNVRGYPVVVGFIFPQINEMLFDDPLFSLYRHSSDVMYSIDADGNIQLDHPSGTYVRIGEAIEHVDLEGKNTDKNLKITRNKEKKAKIRIGLSGGMIELTMSPDGSVSMKATRLDVIAEEVDITANVVVRGDAVVIGNAAIVGDASVIGDMAITGTLSVDGVITSGIDMVSNGTSLKTHVHGGVLSGPSTTAPPS